MVELRNLETFVWVARLASFRLASERLGVTQPAISARIALLEEEFAARLFDRRPPRIALTAAGVELFSRAERMLALRAEMLQAVGQAAVRGGRLRLGVPETIMHTWLPELVERITVEHPSITLDIEVNSTPALRAGLIADRLDIVFLYAAVPDARLATEKLGDFPLGWFASPALELPQRDVSLAQCCQRPVITHRFGSGPYAAVRQVLTQAGLGKARMIGSSAIAGILRLALEGVGVCVVPQPVARRECESGQLRRLDVAENLPPVDFHVSTRRDAAQALPAIVAQLAISVAQEYAAALPETSKRSINDVQKNN